MGWKVTQASLFTSILVAMFLVEYWSPICVLDGSSLITNSNCATPENWWQRARFGFFGGAKDSLSGSFLKVFQVQKPSFCMLRQGGLGTLVLTWFFVFCSTPLDLNWMPIKSCLHFFFGSLKRYFSCAASQVVGIYLLNSHAHTFVCKSNSVQAHACAPPEGLSVDA